MADDPKTPKQAAHANRAQRLALALRENLKRRKAQARGRATAESEEASAPVPREHTRRDDRD
jgi:hypothetical protein